MKRSGFKRKPPPARPNAREGEFDSFVASGRQPLRAALTTALSTFTPRPKAIIVRDVEYRRLVASLPCICCGIERCSQAAHPNTDKGGALKTDDRDCFPMCSERSPNRCHARFDQGAMFTKARRREIEPMWSNSTRMQLRALAQHDAAARRIVERVIGL